MNVWRSACAGVHRRPRARGLTRPLVRPRPVPGRPRVPPRPLAGKRDCLVLAGANFFGVIWEAAGGLSTKDVSVVLDNNSLASRKTKKKSYQTHLHECCLAIYVSALGATSSPYHCLKCQRCPVMHGVVCLPAGSSRVSINFALRYDSAIGP